MIGVAATIGIIATTYSNTTFGGTWAQMEQVGTIYLMVWGVALGV